MEDEGDAHTLGLLVDLRRLCERIGDEHHRMAAELHDLLRQVQNLDREMGFRVQQVDEGASQDAFHEPFRMLSLNCSITLARVIKANKARLAEKCIGIFGVETNKATRILKRVQGAAIAAAFRLRFRVVAIVEEAERLASLALAGAPVADDVEQQ